MSARSDPKSRRRPSEAASQDGETRRGLLAWVAAGLALVATTGVAAEWVQTNLALRYALIFLDVAVGVPCAVAIVRGVGDSRLTPAVRRAALCGSAFAGWALLSAALSGHAAFSVLGAWPEATGALFMVALVGLWALGVTVGRPAGDLVRVTLMGAALVNAAVAVLQVLVDLHGIGLGLYDSRSPGLWSNPVFLSAFLSAAAWLFVDRISVDWRWTVGLAACAAGVQLSGTRLGIIMLAVVALAALMHGWRTAGLAALSMVVGAVLAIGIAGAGPSHSASATSRLAGSDSPTSRVETWIASGHAVASAPVFGTGPGLFEVAAGPRRTLRLVRAEGPDLPFIQAHDIVVEFAVTAGVPGVLLFLGFVGFGFAAASRRDPLVGFAAIGLLGVLLEPNHAALTPTTFLALGVATGNGLRRANAVVPALGGALALALGLVVCVGAHDLRIVDPTPDKARATARSARTILGVWSAPWERSELIDEFVARRTRLRADFQSALQFQLDAAQHEPFEARLWYKAAVLADILGDDAAADRYLADALHDDPWSVATLSEAAVVDVHEGRTADALRALDRALLASPRDPALLERRQRIAALH